MASGSDRPISTTAQEAPGATSGQPARVEPPPHSRARTTTMKTAVEMPSLWKPENGSHRDLGISQQTRDSPIPTSHHSRWGPTEESGNRQAKASPMYPD